MADALGITSSVIALVAFAFKSSTVLYTTLRDIQSQDKKARALKNEVADLRVVLQRLAETVDIDGKTDCFDALKLPLLRCGKTCDEYADLIARCTKHSSGSRSSLRDWISQQYLKGDIEDIKEMLAGYKATINIAIADANLRLVSSIKPEAIEEYKDMLRDTTNDLQEHMNRIEERVQDLATSQSSSRVQDQPEWTAMLEEKQSTQEGLKICLQLSSQIKQLESNSKEHPQFLQQPSAHKLIRGDLGAAKSSIEGLVLRLRHHEDYIDKTMEAMRAAEPLAHHQASQLSQLQETKESLRQCLNVVADAGESLTAARYNIFEDITLADSSYGISVSTVQDLVVARRLNLSGQARYLGGQISDASYQKTIDGLTQLDLANVKPNVQDLKQVPSFDRPAESAPGTQGFERYGRGFNLSSMEK